MSLPGSGLRVGLLWLLASCGGGAGSAIDWDILPLADGARIAEISLNQGAQIVLQQAPGVFGGGRFPPPVIIGRDAVVRVGVFREEDSQDRPVLVELTATSSAGTLEAAAVVEMREEWNSSDPAQVASFPLPGWRVTEDLTLSVEVRELTVHSRGDAVEEATWTSGEELVFARSDTVKLVIIPLRYQADGSGRLPDTSDAQISAIHDAMMAMYPVEDLVVEVREPVTWTRRIGPFDFDAWSALLEELSEQRQRADEPENTYFYGMFNAAESEEEYCAGGCILGLSPVSPNPADTWARASIGVGFSGPIAVETLVHEVGHAHGREHAPCNLYGQPPDPNYPYPGARLGSMGYDIVKREYIESDAATDIMGYCKPIWSSDYTFTALWRRIDALRARSSGERHPWWSFRVKGRVGSRTRDVSARALPGGEPVVVLATYTDGSQAELQGFFTPLSHMDGGRLLLAPQPHDIDQVELLDKEQ